jgi:hypothetical protein
MKARITAGWRKLAKSRSSLDDRVDPAWAGVGGDSIANRPVFLARAGDRPSLATILRVPSVMHQ